MEYVLKVIRVRALIKNLRNKTNKALMLKLYFFKHNLL
jgi:hypothetical protein